jgi:hypothetical protein
MTHEGTTEGPRFLELYDEFCEIRSGPEGLTAWCVVRGVELFLRPAGVFCHIEYRHWPSSDKELNE